MLNRIISRWARLVRSRTTAQRPITKDSGRNASGTLDGDTARASRDGRGIAAPRSSLDDYGKMLRVYRQSAHHADHYKSDADSLLGGRDRSIRPGTGESVRTPSARRVGSNGPRRERGGFPIVTFHVLREILPEMEPPAKAQEESTVPESVVMGNGTRKPSCSTPNNARRSWRFLYSWLIGSGKRDSGVRELARPETPSLPPTPKTALPRITLQVVYTGRVSDMAMLARAEERALAAEDKGEPVISYSPMQVGGGVSGVFPPPTRNGFKAGSVELVRSEVRVISPVEPERVFVGRGTDALGAEPGLESGSVSNTAVKLQVIGACQSPLSLFRVGSSFIYDFVYKTAWGTFVAKDLRGCRLHCRLVSADLAQFQAVFRGHCSMTSVVALPLGYSTQLPRKFGYLPHVGQRSSGPDFPFSE